MPDRNPPLAESMLARAVGPTRAAAIYGDLLELAATRGRRWFWAAYARTVIALLWRPPFAFACGVFVTFGMMEYVFRAWLLLAPHAWRMMPPWHILAGSTIERTAVPLWFFFAYSLVRYGNRDRLVRLAAVLTLAVTLMVPYIPGFSLASAVVGVLTVATAILHSLWRRPMLVLSAAVGIGFLGFVCANAVRLEIPSLAQPERPMNLMIFHLMLAAVLATEAYVCSKAYKALLRPRAGHGSLPIA